MTKDKAKRKINKPRIYIIRFPIEEMFLLFMFSYKQKDKRFIFAYDRC